MIRIAVQRVGQAGLSLLVALLIVFSLVRFTGDPARFFLGPSPLPEDLIRVRAELGLDRPVTEQFATYVGDAARGDLGTSYRFDVPVIDLFLDRLPATLAMGGAALALTLLVAVPLGISAAYRRTGLVDRFARLLAALGQAVPDFWLGLVLILVVAVRLGWLPAGGYGSPQSLVLPAIALAFEPIAILTRLLRSSMIEELGSDHVKFLRVKGLPERWVLWKHALRNASLTTLAYVGILSASLLTGSVLVETVFVWPGVGRLLVEAVEVRDFAVVQGLVLLILAALIAINLLVDLLQLALNPRMRTT